MLSENVDDYCKSHRCIRDGPMDSIIKSVCTDNNDNLSDWIEYKQKMIKFT